MQRPWGGVRAWNKMISVTSLKDVFVCGDGVGARDEIENIGIEMIRQHLTCSDGKVGLYSEYAVETKNLQQKHAQE